MSLKAYLLPTVACLFLLLVFLAPGNIDDLAPRTGFILVAVFGGYLYLRHRFRYRHIKQPRLAFQKRRHRAEIFWKTQSLKSQFKNL